MSNPVFANGMNVSCKSGDAKVICAFPDVCLSPPSPPAGPIPIPYPVTSMSSDTSDGSGTVKVNNKEVMLKDKSTYSKCTGDEAATRSFGSNVINHALSGKVFFKMWSMDVKFEGENAVRAFDITTSNHACPAGAAVPMVNTEGMDPATADKCKGVDAKFQLKPYKDKNGDYSCASPLTGHHVIPGRCLRNASHEYPKGCSHDKAPVICLVGKNQYSGTHGDAHAVFDLWEYEQCAGKPSAKIDYTDARDKGAEASMAGAGKPSKKGKKAENKALECMKSQLDAYYKNCLDPLDDAQVNGRGKKAGLNLRDLKPQNAMQAATA